MMHPMHVEQCSMYSLLFLGRIKSKAMRFICTPTPTSQWLALLHECCTHFEHNDALLALMLQASTDPPIGFPDPQVSVPLHRLSTVPCDLGDGPIVKFVSEVCKLNVAMLDCGPHTLASLELAFSAPGRLPWATPTG